MTVDHKLLLEGISPAGGWNSKQLALLGLAWPPAPNWQRGVIGRSISEEDAKLFRELAGQNCRKERTRRKALKSSPPAPDLSEHNAFVIYCDGGCVRPRKAGAWAYVRLKNGVQVGGTSMAYRKTTNNRMELMAAIAGLMSTHDGDSVIVRTDSQYVVKGIDLGWAMRWARNRFRMGDPKLGGKRPNWDLWQQLLELCASRQVKFKWVKGHNGDAMNEKCDQMAEKAMHDGPFLDDTVFVKLLLENGGKW